MREMKFRAWDSKQNKMINIDSRITALAALNQQEDWYPMQFTGVKDKNGVEIFEGDVLRCVKVYRGKINGCKYKTVKWVHTTVTNGWNICSNTKFEVIGNIYENPKLLTKPAA